MAEKGPWEEGRSTGSGRGHDRGLTGPAASGSTSGAGRPPRRFNPAWLLVPAVGLLLGGMGIANMHGRPPATPAPTVTVTGPATTVTRPVAPIGRATSAPGCDLGFLDTKVRTPTARIQNDWTGEVLNAPSGRAFVIVDTTLTNSGTEICYATPGYQRAYVSGTTYYTGNVEAGDQLTEGRLMTRPIEPGKSVDGAYVFPVPSGSKVGSVRLRSNGSDKWTIVNVG